MAASMFSDSEFIAAWQEHKSPAKLSEIFHTNVRNVYRRRRSVEIRYGLKLSIEEHKAVVQNHAARISLSIPNGTVIVFSDAHFWNTEPTTAFRALIKFIQDLKPAAVICNGDAFDGAAISRHPHIGFLEKKPSVMQELTACKEMLTRIEDVAKGATLTWPLGNHDLRFESYLAARTPEFAGIDGFHLKDHFPRWAPCWATWINDLTVVKHRYKGGIHATHNNTVNSGTNIVTGHLHSLKVTPFSDYTGTRYGVDTGTLADVHGDQFVHYLETNPTNWRSGFAVLSFWNGKLLLPELVEVIEEGRVCFRGAVHEV
jgi:metallophosphoesterase superfamily enzyme